MSFHEGLTREKLQKASAVGPDGYRRLARFVGADGLSVEEVLRACHRHRAEQRLATPVRDRRVSNE